MQTIVCPRPVTVEPQPLRSETRRECFLLVRRQTVGLTWHEDLELKRLQLEADLRQQALDEIAEANAEGRIPHYSELRASKNFHD
jgi:hypothetical protein